jgi:hypothetical protein
MGSIARAVVIGLSLLIIALVAATAGFRPDRVMRVATGTVAQTLCSGVFISGQPPDQVFAEYLRPERGLSHLAPRLHYAVDPEAKQVNVTWAGLFASRAV